MTSLDFPEIVLRPLRLTEEMREVKGHTSAPLGSPVATQVELAVQSVAVTAEYAKGKQDTELLQYLHMEQGRFGYFAVRLILSIRPQNRETLEKAWVEVNLTSGQTPPPVVWSMEPENVFDTFERTSGAKLGANLKLVSTELGSQKKIGGRNYSVRAYNAGTSKCFWEMRRTEVAALDGMFPFHMIVRAPSGIAAEGTVNFSMLIGKRKFAVLRTHQEVPDARHDSFRLVPPA